MRVLTHGIVLKCSLKIKLSAGQTRLKWANNLKICQIGVEKASLAALEPQIAWDAGIFDMQPLWE